MGFFDDFASGLSASMDKPSNSSGRTGLLSSIIPARGLLGQFIPEGGLFGSAPKEDTPKSLIPSVEDFQENSDAKTQPASPNASNVNMQGAAAPVMSEIQDSLNQKFPKAYKIAQALAQVESGGRYSAIGPTVNNDNAVGKYQVMGNNIPQWTKEATGQSATPSEFKSNANLQDRVAVYKINALLQQGYHPQDIASIWLSGRPLAGNNRADKATGVTVPQYVQRFNKYYGI